jgi:hypothetical protein
MRLRPPYFLLFAFWLASGAAAQLYEGRTGGPFVPTPQSAVDAMLELAQVGARDFVVDLGSGDGRIVLTAARRYGARGLGIDLDPELVDASNAEAEKLQLARLVSFRQQDVLEARIADATVVTLYLLPGLTALLAPRFLTELKPGARIVSHDFQLIDGWKADRERVVDVDEKYGSKGAWKSTVLLWIVPARVEGEWRLTAGPADTGSYTLKLKQTYQRLAGEAARARERSTIRNGALLGTAISFQHADARRSSVVWSYRGTVDGDRMSGERTAGGKTVPWSATRGDVPAVQR